MAALEQSGGPVEFTALFEDFRDSNDRSVVIATFMALLELIRRGSSARVPGSIATGRSCSNGANEAAPGETPPPPAGAQQP